MTEIINVGTSPKEKLVPVSMYAISGHGTVNTEKYIRDKRQDGLINQEIVSRLAIDVIPSAPESERAALIREALAKEDVGVQVKAADMIRFAPESEKMALIREALEKENTGVQTKATGMIRFAPESERAALIREALAKEDVGVQVKAADMTPYAPDNEKEELKVLISAKVREALAKEDIGVQARGSEMTQYVPENEVDELRELVSAKIREAFAREDVGVQTKATRMIWGAPESERTALVREALAKEDIVVQAKAAGMIWCAPESKHAELRELVSAKIREAFAKENTEVQTKAAEMIRFAPESEQMALIREALAKEDIGVHIKAVRTILFAPESKQAELRALMWAKIRETISKGLGYKIIEPPLYRKEPDMGTGNFERKAFEKTGSGTTLIGGPLKDKLIIRHIAPEAFVAWQKAYESYQVWKNAGFDYVPIEPIQSYRFNSKKRLVDVYSGVLDLSLNDWLPMSGDMFRDELSKQRDKIKGIVGGELYIEHGHAHDDNFALRFFRDADGKPDFTKVPRLYLIDFDTATS